MEGDRAALETVLAAVATHRAALDEGAVDCVVTAPPDGPLAATNAKFSCAWRGDRAFTRFKWEYPVFPAGSDVAKERRWSGEFRILRTPEATYSFQSRKNTLHLSLFPPDSGELNLVENSRFWPRWDWFANHGPGYEKAASRWDVAYDPARVDANTTTVKFVVDADADEVRVSRTFENGNGDWILASRDAGWNVVSYSSELAPGVKNGGTRGTFEWEQNPDGVWWVRRTTRGRFRNGREGSTVTAEFSNFRTAAPAGVTFKEADLDLPTDTPYDIWETSPNGRRTRTVGRRSGSGVAGSKLNDLGRLLRDGSFLGGEDEE